MQSKNKRSNKVSNVTNKKNKFRKKGNRRFRGRTLPAALTLNTPKRFNNIITTGTSATVTGCDLIYSIPDTIEAAYQNTQVIALLPCNPAYWLGTRVSAIAQGYQNYRPLKFEVIYVPQCAVTQQGNVLAGSLWDVAPSDNNLQQTLKTSNGGMLTQCYQTSTSIVRMKSNLQYNLYRMGGTIDQESNPFVYIALAIGCTNANGNRIIPGYFYVRYSYIFKNPIGTGIKYQNSQLIQLSSKNQFLLNASLYLAQSIRTANGLEIPVGARLDIEYNNSTIAPGYLYLYNGTEVQLGVATVVWVLENQPHTITTKLTQVIKEYVDIPYTEIKNSGDSTQVNLDPYTSISFVNGDQVITWLNNTLNAQTYYFPQPDTEYYKTNIDNVDLGKLIENSYFRQAFSRAAEFTNFVKII